MNLLRTGGYMLKDIKAVIFDLDGTLVDSMWIWKDIDIEFLSQYGIELPSDLQDCIEGMSFTETATYVKERFRLPTSVEEIKNIWNKMAYEKYLNEVPLKEGVLEFLIYLKNNNIKTGIATSNSVELVKTVIKKHEIDKYFDAVHTSCEVAKGKPAPDIYELVASKLGVEPEHCLVFEDVIQGIMAGKSAKMTVCAIDDEFSKHQLEQKIELADHIISSYCELLEME